MNTVPLWVTLLGVAVPLITLAGSAVAYIIKLYLDGRLRRREHFFELMKFIDSNAPIATKMAAIYQLRQFPEHRDFIIRFCKEQQGNITGPSSSILIAEMEATRKFFEQRSPKSSRG